MSINISRTPVTQPTSDKFIYTTLFLYADSQERLTDTTSLQEINLSEFPEAARDWIESFYGVVDGLKRLVTKSVQGQKYTGHKEFDYCHYVCIDTANINMCSQLSDHLEGSRNLFVTLSGLENQNKNTYVLIVQQPQTAKYYLSHIYPLILPPEGLVSGAVVTAGNLFTSPENMDFIGSSATVTGGLLRDTLRSTGMDHDDLSTEFTVTGGLLRDVLKISEMSPDGLDTSFTVTGGLLKEGLISTTCAPESLAVSATITGGLLA